jgi:hypothetical protein
LVSFPPSSFSTLLSRLMLTMQESGKGNIT